MSKQIFIIRLATKAYIVANGEVVAEVTTLIKSGESVEFSSIKTEEKINQGRKFNLVNVQKGKILRAKKWSIKFRRQGELQKFGSEINTGEFLIK